MKLCLHKRYPALRRKPVRKKPKLTRLQMRNALREFARRRQVHNPIWHKIVFNEPFGPSSFVTQRSAFEEMILMEGVMRQTAFLSGKRA